MLVTCLLPMKLKSGGAIPNPTQTRASSDTLLPSIALVRLAGAADAGESPCGEFIFAAVGGENGLKGRDHETWLKVYTDRRLPRLLILLVVNLQVKH